MKRILFALLITFQIVISNAQKPNVWIYTDMSDRGLKGPTHMGTVNDPDDISAMGGYLLMCNEFNTLGVVVSSTHRKEHVSTGNQADWANTYFGNAYKQDRKQLQKNLKCYPKKIEYMQSCIKVSSERFSPDKSYTNLSNYNTVEALIVKATKLNDTINVLCWGSLTEPAILVKHCIETGKTDILKKMRFIAHWTNSSLHQGTVEQPWKVANCNEDIEACNYLKGLAYNNQVTFFELGAIGQHGIVNGSQFGDEYYNQFKVSALGQIFIEGKYVSNGVDDSDAATYWTLLGKYGVSLNNVPSNGTNSAEIETENEKRFLESAKSIREELLRRAKIAGTK